MCLYLVQKSGSLNDAADEFFNARHAGATLDELKAIYKRATGKSFPESVTSVNDCWVLYNATRAIRTHYDMPSASWDRMSVEYGYWFDDMKANEAWARRVARVHGGEWKVVYEY